jgi:DNA-binding transcriptional LysR family regulator
MVNWNNLQIFLSIARHGSLARAARAHRLDPTTLGRRIAALEAEAGQTLFERSSEGYVPTAYGRSLLPHAEAMEQAARRVDAAMADAHELRGLVRVSVSEGFGTWFIAPRLPRFFARHPEIELDLVASSGLLNPSKREADLAILLGQPQKGPLVARRLADYCLGLYASTAEPPFIVPPSGTKLSGAGLPIIGYIPDFLYAPQLNYLDEIEPGLEATIRCSSINAQHQMVASGLGVGVLPCFIANTDSRLSRIWPQKTIRRSFWLAMHRDVSAQPRVRAFVDWIANELASGEAVLTTDLCDGA